MGAIYGLVGEDDLKALAVMGARLLHRGRSSGEWSVAPQVLFGERSHTGEARCFEVEGSTLIGDADLYNSEELIRELAGQGAQFDTNRPEEVILRGYARWGNQVFNRLNGDFAVAIWDSRNASLLLVRDPLGARPLYYWQGAGMLAFASEYKALLALPMVPATPDNDAVQTLQYSKYPPANQTLLKGIFSVPAGHVMVWKQGHLETHRFWDLAIEPKEALQAEYASDVRAAFLKAIERRLVDMEVGGATLSGGVDSISVVAAARTVMPDLPFHTFTAGYGSDDPEMHTAEVVAQTFGTQHHPIVVDASAIPGRLTQVVWHLEDPIARSEVLQAFEVAQVASQYVDVVLAGYASDGLFAGMPKHKILRLIQRLPILKTPLEEFYSYTQVSVPPASLAGRALQRVYYRGTDALPPGVIGAKSISPDPLPAVSPEFLNEVLRSGVVYGVPKWLPKAERMHMAHALRFRSPFIDRDLVQLAFQIPDRYKISGWREKHIFREAIKPLLPPEILNRPKFPQSMKYDLAFSEVMDAVSDLVLSPERVKSRGFFQVEDIQRLRRRPSDKAYTTEQSMRLWTAVMTELWAQTFIDQRGEPLPALQL